MLFNKNYDYFFEKVLRDNKLSNKVIHFTKKNKDRNPEKIFHHLEKTLSGSRITLDRARFFRGREEKSSDVFKKGTDKLGEERFYLIENLLYSELLQGGTFVFDSINEFKGDFNDNCSFIAKIIQCSSSANLYVSYGSYESFGRHKDNHGVIVQQLYGSKTWLFDNEDENITLYPGDLLYVPQNWYHNPICDSEKSIHVTYSVCKPNMLDLMNWISKNLSSEELININIDEKEDIINFFRNSKKINAFLKSSKDKKTNQNEKRMFP